MVLANAAVKKIMTGREKRISQSFHSGGEPTYEFDLLKAVADYSLLEAEKSGTEVSFEISTNLVFKDETILDYFIHNHFLIHVSIDGVEKVQNTQRPYINGSATFETVIRNMDYIMNKGGQASARLTVTGYSVNYIIDSVTFLAKRYPQLEFIKLEPLETTPQSEKMIGGALNEKAEKRYLWNQGDVSNIMEFWKAHDLPSYF